MHGAIMEGEKKAWCLRGTVKKDKKSLLLAVWKPFNWVPDKLQLVAVPSDEKKD